MAASFFSISSLPKHTLPYSSSSSPTSSPAKFSLKCMNNKEENNKEKDKQCSSDTSLSRRCAFLSTCLGTALAFSLSGHSQAAILEADDDLELLEKVKKDREKRLQRQGVISSLKKETGYLQELVYRLSKVGEAIDSNDLPSAGSVLAKDDWLKNVNLAFTKLSSSPEEKAEVDAFNSSFASLISSVDKQEINPAKSAFVSSATAFEKWVELTGLVGQLKGL